MALKVEENLNSPYIADLSNNSMLITTERLLLYFMVKNAFISFEIHSLFLRNGSENSYIVPIHHTELAAVSRCDFAPSCP